MNRVTIEPTIFVNARSEHKSQGVRVYDNYAQTYCNTWDSIPDDDLEVLKLVAKMDDENVKAMLEHLIEEEKGVEIGGEFYAWEVIRPILVPEKPDPGAAVPE